MTDREEMVEAEKIFGVKITKPIKYLGVTIYCDRQKTVDLIKKQAKKYVDCLKGIIQTKNLTLMHILFSAFYRSMIIYFMTPLHAAGAITEDHHHENITGAWRLIHLLSTTKSIT